MNYEKKACAIEKRAYQKREKEACTIEKRAYPKQENYATNA